MDSPSIVFSHPSIRNSPLLTGIFLMFIFMSCYTVLNMLVGVLCDVASEVSRQEKDETDVAFLKHTVQDILHCYDRDGDHMLHRQEFELLMQNPEMRVALSRFGVDIHGLTIVVDMYYENALIESDPEQLSFGEFLEVVL